MYEFALIGNIMLYEYNLNPLLQMFEKFQAISLIVTK